MSLTCQRPPWSPFPFPARPARLRLSGPWWPLSRGRGRCLYGGGGPHTGLSKHLPKTAPCPSDWALPFSCPLLSTHHTQRSWWKSHRRAPAPSPVRPTPSPGEALGTCRVPWAAWSCSGSRQGPGISLLRAELPPPSCPPTPLRCAQLPPGIPVATAASWGGGLPPQTFPCLRARFETRFPCSQSLNTARAFSEVIRGPCVGPSGTPPTTLPVVQSSWTQTRRGLRGGVFRGARSR